MIAFTKVQEVLESKAQTECAVEDLHVLLFLQIIVCCVHLAVPWLVLPHRTRVSADCVAEHLL